MGFNMTCPFCNKKYRFQVECSCAVLQNKKIVGEMKDKVFCESISMGPQSPLFFKMVDKKNGTKFTFYSYVHGVWSKDTKSDWDRAFQQVSGDSDSETESDSSSGSDGDSEGTDSDSDSDDESIKKSTVKKPTVKHSFGTIVKKCIGRDSAGRKCPNKLLTDSHCKKHDLELQKIHGFVPKKK